MITFLRKIRKSLIDSGSAQRYMVYAFGEVVLVVIGILIALQINNWNEQRKTHLADIEFLQNLRNELIIDTVTYHSRIKIYQEINDNIAESIKIITSNKPLSENEDALISKTLKRIEILTPLYKNIGRNDIQVADGRLERINSELNAEYLSYLERFQSNSQAMVKLGESLQMMSINYIQPKVSYNYVNENSQKDKVLFDIESIRKDLKFMNVFHRSFRWREEYIKALGNHIYRVKSILAIIDRELKTLK